MQLTKENLKKFVEAAIESDTAFTKKEQCVISAALAEHAGKSAAQTLVAAGEGGKAFVDRHFVEVCMFFELGFRAAILFDASPWDLNHLPEFENIPDNEEEI